MDTYTVRVSHGDAERNVEVKANTAAGAAKAKEVLEALDEPDEFPVVLVIRKTTGA